MGECTDAHQLKEKLVQLRCHFTWELVVEDSAVPDLEKRIWEEIEFLDTKYNVGIHNLLAYVKHLQGRNEEALQSLKEAEDLIQKEHADLSDIGSLVTWGNYAWLYYHMGRLEEAQTYLDKVENTCQKFASMFCYRMECPEMDCAEGWALLKCGRQNYEQARYCFAKALKVEPENPEFNTGYAIALYRLDSDHNAISLNPLQQAVRLNPSDTYIKVLLALKLQDVKREDEGEIYIEEALSTSTSLVYILRYAGKFYRRKGCMQRALQLLERALQESPTSAFVHHQIGLCYRAQVLQINNATRTQPRGQEREKLENMIGLAIFHFKSALEQKHPFEVVFLHLAHMYVAAKNYRKAEHSFQEFLLTKPQEKNILQDGHFYYARFLEFQKKSEVDAIRHYLKAIEVKYISPVREKSIFSLEKLALRRLRRNEVDLEGLSLLGLVYKLKGKIHEALEYYEQALSLAAASNKAVKYIE
ncbi:interferon-induced protein with tetratricopeptide repeats 1-like [Perognathus longimembris pacificus]|uniref:interferon-induced protein with tetratricopeptide repeats 1-like n=1 Tax=Perognathus longimembris pacificus TaxID=214514 RepID=UPI00201949E5|nr:interferon-induced protein with tetratricopeptide repeats 1-like [Perognathus longimembris pacificus]